MLSVISFVFCVLLALAPSWADNWYNERCYGDRGPCGYICGSCSAPNGGTMTRLNYSVGDEISVAGYDRCVVTFNSNPPTQSCTFVDYCSNSYLSLKCCKMGTCPEGQGFSLEVCDCVNLPPPPEDTTWQCQNAGGPEPGGFGSPYYAKIFACVTGGNHEDVQCTNTRDLYGSCQDWGFCPPGVEDCQIPDSLGRPPCGRSGNRYVQSARCTYACADGNDLNCKPVSTGYVAGNIYAGECPEKVPDGCRPSSSSSGGGSSGSSSPSSSPSGGTSVPADTARFPAPGGGEDIELDYTQILNAIKDTLHVANMQRDFIAELNANMSLDLDNIAEYSQYAYTAAQKTAQNTASLGTAVSGLASTVSTMSNTVSNIASSGVPLPAILTDNVSASRDLLDEINSFLRSDSLNIGPGRSDTVYNPLLRDIKNSIDSIDVTISVSGDSSGSLIQRDTAFYKWFARYYADSVQSTSVVGTALKQFVPSSDSSRVASCDGWRGCMAVYSDMSYCSSAWSVSLSDCVEGGTPLDGIWNVETSILSKIVKAFWGDDTTDISTPESADTNVNLGQNYESAMSGLLGTLNSLFSPESTTALINKVRMMKDSAEKRANDSVQVQPDSLWLDSSDAARYARNMLLPVGTGNDCFICHADLGDFGGLAKRNLSIHVDFGNFGGFNWCDIIRTVIKIVSFVVCMSLTLGSWAAAFGYNPKNDG